MRQGTFFLLTFFACSSSTIQTSIKQLPQKPRSTFFLFKKFYKALRIFYFCDQAKFDTIGVTCNQCSYFLKTSEICWYFASPETEYLFDKLLSLVQKDSIEKLAQFLLFATKKYTINCPRCLKETVWLPRSSAIEKTNQSLNSDLNVTSLG